MQAVVLHTEVQHFTERQSATIKTFTFAHSQPKMATHGHTMPAAKGGSTVGANSKCQPWRTWSDPVPDELAARAASEAINKKSSFRPYHAIRVPKSTSLANGSNKAHAEESSTPVTTVMLRHIPNKYTQANLLDEINQEGFVGRYDFFYLPMDMHNRTNVGYAFINFLTPQDAQLFKARMTDYKFHKYSSHKIAKVAPAHIQGLVRNLYHFANRAVAQSQDVTYRPIVMCNGLARDCLEVLEDHRRAEMGRLRTSGYPTPSTDEVPLTSLTAPGDTGELGNGFHRVAGGVGESVQNCELAQEVSRRIRAPQHSDEMREDFNMVIHHLHQASSVLAGLCHRGNVHLPNYQAVNELTRAINGVAARVKDVGANAVQMPFQEFASEPPRSDDLSLSSSGSTTPPPSSYQSGLTGLKYIDSFPQSESPDLTPRRSQMLLGSDLWNANSL